MKASLLLFICLTMLTAAPASADFYKYVDENGNIRFTDDITMIPPDQRKKLKVYEEAAPAEPTQTRPGKTEDRQSPPDQKDRASESQPTGDGAVSEETLRAMKKRLDEKKAALSEEYNALVEERKALESRRREYRSRGRIDEYEDAIDRLNEKNAAYERKRKQFEEEVDAYNEANRQYRNAAPKAAGRQ